MSACRTVQVTVIGDDASYIAEIKRMIEKNNGLTEHVKQAEMKIIQLQKETIEHQHAAMELLERVRVLKNELAEIKSRDGD